MMRYVIRAVPKRINYVNKLLVPSMLKQGISEDDITIHLDDSGEGVLQSFVNVCRSLPDEGYTVHLQDDIIISRDFREVCESDNHNVMCGFCSIYDPKKDYGEVTPDYMWYSFPCIKIKNSIAHDFCDWLEASKHKMAAYIAENKHDDLLFLSFIKERKETSIMNVAPNIVNHIDYLLGGSVANFYRDHKTVKSVHWKDNDILEDYELNRNNLFTNL